MSKVTKILLINYQKKLKCLEKKRSAWFINKSLELISTIQKIFRYSFCWSYLEFSDRMDLIIRLRILNNTKHSDANYVKSADRFFSSLTMLGPESKASVCFTIS